MSARASFWRDAVDVRAIFSAFDSSFHELVGARARITGVIGSKQFKQELGRRRIALILSLVFNVVSQKNAISDGFCPFISARKKRRQQVCMTHLFFETVRKVYLVRSI